MTNEIEEATPTAQSVRRQNLVGPAGEHWVLSRLLLEGVPAALAPAGMRGIDLLVFDLDAQVSAGIQVKATTDRGRGSWALSDKHERWAPAGCFYALVSFTNKAAPATWIVPAHVVADAVRSSYEQWMVKPTRDGGPRKRTSIRRLEDPFPYPVPGFPNGWLAPYQEAWAQLC